jgi:hypothetical protein
MKVLIGSDTYYPDVNGASYFTQRLADAYRGGDTRCTCFVPPEVFVRRRCAGARL